MRAKTISLAVVATFAIAAPANAGLVVVTADPVQKAISVANGYWGNGVCGGNYHIAYQPVVSVPVDGGPATQAIADGREAVQAWVTLPDPTCTINVVSSIWTPEAQATRFQDFCDVIAHEVGHFFGHLDAGQTDPASINYPAIGESTPNYNAVPGCIGATVRQESWVPTAHEKALAAEELKEADAISYNSRHHKRAKHTHKPRKVHYAK